MPIQACSMGVFKRGIGVSGRENWSVITAPDLPADILPGTQ